MASWLRASAGFVMLALAVLGCAPGARADTYDVKACWRPYANASWFSDPALPGTYTTAYSSCPPGEGIVTRMSGGSGTAPFLAYHRMFFRAPAGARIVEVSGAAHVHEGHGWQAGVVDNSTGRWVWCGTGTCNLDFWAGFHAAISGSEVSIQTICGLRAGCSRGGLYGLMAIRDVTVTVNDLTAPVVRLSGPLASRDWHAGDQWVRLQVLDNTGFSYGQLGVYPGNALPKLEGQCNNVTPMPCANFDQMVRIPESEFQGDGRHRVYFQAVDGGHNGARTELSVLIDNTPPAQLSNLELVGGAGWRDVNAFALKWANPARQAAPIVGAEYQLCPMGADRNSNQCVRGSRTRTNITSIGDLKVPRPGAWRVDVWLRDAAGNQDPQRSIALEALRFDAAPPTLKMLPLAAGDPARLRWSARDPVSGVAGAQVELRRKGTTAWRPVPARLGTGGFSAFVDDSRIRNGRYDVRARVWDAAGNERSTDRDSAGRAASIRVPLRLDTHLVAGRTRVVRRGRRLVTRYRARTRIAYGRTVVLRGRLTSAGRNPIAGAPIQVSQRVKLDRATWRQIGRIDTSRTGRFAFRVPRGPSRRIRFLYPGTATVRGRMATVDVGVRAMSTLRPNRRSFLNGDEAIFRGRVRGVKAGGPAKIVVLQARTRTGWLTFATPRADARTGRWSARHLFAATHGRVRYSFRALVPRQAGFPYETGHSRTVSVIVRG